MNKRLLPTGKCWCGCDKDVPRGSFFLAGHDRRAESAVIQIKYGSVVEFLDAYGYTPDGKGLQADFAAYLKKKGK
jgi:hypothetical protein